MAITMDYKGSSGLNNRRTRIKIVNRTPIQTKSYESKTIKTIPNILDQKLGRNIQEMSLFKVTSSPSWSEGKL